MPDVGGPSCLETSLFDFQVRKNAFDMLALKSQLIGAALVLAFCAEKTYADFWLCPADCSRSTPRKEDYRKHCEAETGPAGADPKWPCFTIWSGDLDRVFANSSASGKAPGDFFLIKDDSMKDFTTVDPTKDFNLQWDQGSLQMSYSDFDKVNGCFKITLEYFGYYDLRIWVSAETSQERDIDTWKHQKTSKFLCTKWVHIHVKNDGRKVVLT
ncbi:related to Mig1 protein, induced during biotrophic phase [Ustilago sp. UG-2017b]|nr:related to Mig1 protein, induced during biotrophic phase [Ustilago sp. UG-2017b]